MSMVQRSYTPTFLRRVLQVDGLATGATAALLIGGAQALAPLLGLPAGLLRTAGLLCLLFATWVLWLSRRSATPSKAMAGTILVNFAWVAASAWVAFGPVWRPTVLGVGFVCGQALVVLAFAELGWIGMRAARAARNAMA